MKTIDLRLPLLAVVLTLAVWIFTPVANAVAEVAGNAITETLISALATK